MYVRTYVHNICKLTLIRTNIYTLMQCISIQNTKIQNQILFYRTNR